MVLSILESFLLLGNKVTQLWLTFVTDEPDETFLASGRLEAIAVFLREDTAFQYEITIHPGA